MNKHDPREALKALMERNGLNAHALAKKANVQPSTLYNLMSGVSKSLSVGVAQKLADALDTSVDAILGNAPVTSDKIDILWEVGVLGKLFELDHPLQMKRPVGIGPDEDVIAAIASGDTLRPMPGEWSILFRRQSEDPDGLLGKLCIVRIANSAQPMIREIRRGTRRGIYHLSYWSAAPIEDATLAASHLIISMTQK